MGKRLFRALLFHARAFASALFRGVGPESAATPPTHTARWAVPTRTAEWSVPRRRARWGVPTRTGTWGV